MFEDDWESPAVLSSSSLRPALMEIHSATLEISSGSQNPHHFSASDSFSASSVLPSMSIFPVRCVGGKDGGFLPQTPTNHDHSRISCLSSVDTIRPFFFSLDGRSLEAS